MFDERVVLGVIAFNMLVLFVSGFPAVQSSAIHPILGVADYICLLYFFIEIVVKVRAYGWAGFWSKGMNRFDFVIVALSAPGLVAPFTGTTDLSVLVVLRAFRLVRLIRVLRFIPHAEMLWAGILRALRASVALILALMVYNLVLGLMASNLFGSLSAQHFGDPLISIYTIFKVFTVEGWFEVPDQIAKTHSATLAWMVRGFFVVAVVTGGLLGLSLTNAVLVDEMVMDNNTELEGKVEDVTTQMERNTELLAEVSRKLDELLDRSARGPPDDA